MSRLIPTKLGDLAPPGTLAAIRTAEGETLHVAADGATVTFDMEVSRLHAVTLGGNRTLAVAHATAGQPFTLIINQDGTGSRTVTWFSGIRWFGGSAPTLTTTANKSDAFRFIPLTATTFLGEIIGQNG